MLACKGLKMYIKGKRKNFLNVRYSTLRITARDKKSEQHSIQKKWEQPQSINNIASWLPTLWGEVIYHHCRQSESVWINITFWQKIFIGTILKVALYTRNGVGCLFNESYHLTFKSLLIVILNFSMFWFMDVWILKTKLCTGL